MIKGGPKIIDDSLVLCLDAHDAKSYVGEPVANLVTSSAVDFSVRTTYSGNTFSQVADSESPSGYACEMSYTTFNSSARSRFGAATNIPTSGTGFVSIWVKKSVGPSTTMRPAVYTGYTWYNLDPLDGGSSYLTEEYRPFGKAVSFGTASGGPNPGFSMTNGGGSTASDKTRWIKPQVTTLSYNVPFSNLTRPNQIDFISHGDVGSGTTFTDSSVNNLTLTSANGASHAGTGPFGGSAMSFVRASSQQITSPSTSLCDFGTGDFTIDFWFNMNSGTATNTRMHALNIGSGSSTNVSFDFNDGGYGIWLYWMSGGGNYIRQSGNYRNDGLWHHCAFVRDNGTCRLWIDGAYIGGVSYATQIGATQSLYIGSTGGQYWDGYIDEVRIVKGTALWKGSSDFAPPTSRGKNAPLLDRTTNNNSGTLVNGTDTGVSHYRDGQVIMPVANSYLDFDGSDDYVNLPHSELWQNISQISYDLWFKPDVVNVRQGLISSHAQVSGANNDAIEIEIQSNGTSFVGFRSANGTFYSATYGTSLSANTWYNLTGVLSSSDIKYYLNGQLVVTQSNWPGGNVANSASQTLMLARYATYYFNGKIGSFRAYNKALTAAEVLSNYNTTKNRFT
ncbi:LamG domain-containing protein [Verrucomicrobia bacterium]|nr:LamG domain-containing protein [Verrucomicrobiota bacterium]